MAYTRNQSGARTIFRSTHLSDRITRAYIQVYGPQTPEFRQRIVAQTDWIMKHLADEYGSGSGSDWPLDGIHDWTIKGLTYGQDEKSAAKVVEAFSDQNQEPPPASKVQGVREPDHLYDPSWNIVFFQDSGLETVPLPQFDWDIPDLHISENHHRRAHHRHQVQHPVRRHQWLEWMARLCQELPHQVDFAVLEKVSVRDGDKPQAHTVDEWFRFWHETVYMAMQEDPRMFALLRIIHHRRSQARLIGQTWVHGSRLTDSSEAPPLDFSLDGTPAGEASYRALWLEHMTRLLGHQRMDQRLKSAFDLGGLAAAIQPARDLQIDQSGYETLAEGGGLWKILPGYAWQCQQGWKSDEGALEPPQWAWMRLAMGMAVSEVDPQGAALLFYDAISSLGLIPGEVMIRQAGLSDADFLEDRACRVEDRFEGIYEAIYRAAVDTKWTGAVTMDWRQVRSAGHAIGGSRRRSLGVLPFLKMAEAAMVAQGREGDDRPVSVALPLWHREAEGFISFQYQQAPRLQTVLIVPDMFMQRLAEHGVWNFFDPFVFPEVLQRGGGYEAAEKHAEDRRRHYPKSVRTIRADRVWKKIVQSASKGGMSLTFEGSERFFSPFYEKAPPVCGREGVGALPLTTSASGTQGWVSWPSMALNLKQCLEEDGSPSVERLKHLMEQGLRILDNAITASNPDARSTDSLLRPVCLGAVGLHEAVRQAGRRRMESREISLQWISALSEAWAASMLYADQMLVQSRGAAPGWKEFGGGSINPVSAVKEWRQTRGSLGVVITPKYNWDKAVGKLNVSGQRHAAGSVWAPFQAQAAIGRVSPGGVGSLPPFVVRQDEYGVARRMPSPMLMDYALENPEDVSGAGCVLGHPEDAALWPDAVRKRAAPDAQGWSMILEEAALIRPFAGQGVVLTIPYGKNIEELSVLLQQSWWRGVSTVRFAGSANQPVSEEVEGGAEGSLDQLPDQGASKNVGQNAGLEEVKNSSSTMKGADGERPPPDEKTVGRL